MTIAEKLDKLDLEIDNIVPLRKILGGKTPPPKNWLMQLNPNTTFLARSILEYTVDLTEYIVVGKTFKSVLLQMNMSEKEVLTWVDPIRFCNKVELIEILREG